MNFNKHLNLEGKHAFLSASKYHWINYTKEKLIDSYNKYYATLRGTELHDLACHCIKLGVRLPKSKATLNMYVNDAINYRMTPEQPLYYSQNCFGTADTISFRKNYLRIHDLKTGTNAASINQLMIYAALFCLEYEQDPYKIGMELRIYQNDDVLICEPNPNDINTIMERIVEFDKIIESLRKENEI